MTPAIERKASGHSDERKRFVGHAYEAAEGAEALVATDWEEFKGALSGALKSGRNLKGRRQ